MGKAVHYIDTGSAICGRWGRRCVTVKPKLGAGKIWMF